MSVYVVKTTHSNGELVQGVFKELNAGCARMDWSPENDQVLRRMKHVCEQGEQCTEYQP